MKKTLLVYLTVITAQFSFAQQSFQWAKIFKGTANIESVGVTVDSQDNVICTGRFSGVADFDPGPGTFTIDAVFGYDIFVCKLDNNGDFLWAKHFDGSQWNCGKRVVTDASGNIYITGFLYQTVDFDPGPSTYTLSGWNNDIFICKLDPNGNFVWAKDFGGSANEEPWKIDLDASGNIFLCGFFNGTCDFDPDPPSVLKTSVGADDAFVVKFDPNGNFLWVNTFGGNLADCAYAFDLDSSGAVYVTGYYQSTVDMDPSPGVDNHISFGVQDAYISKFDATGNFLWCKTMGSTGPDWGCAIHIDNFGNIYVGGSYQDSCDFDLGSGTIWVNAYWNGSGFIIKMDQNTNYVWHRVIDSQSSVLYDIEEDANGDIATFGIFNGAPDFDPGPGVTIVNSNNGGHFIYKMTPVGSFLLAKSYGGGAGNFSLAEIAMDSNSSIFATGSFAWGADFDPSPTATYSIAVTSPGIYEGFVSKIWGVCIIPTTSPVNITNSNALNICTGNITVLNVLSAMNVKWYNSPTSTISIGTGTAFATPTLAVGSYTYYAADFTCGSGPRIPIVVNVAACTNIGEPTKTTGITVFPNPVDEEISLSLNGIGKCELRIYSSLGLLVVEKNLEIDLEKISLSQLSKGIYLLDLTKDSKIIYSDRIIKK